jgi:hypothetical protein
MKRFFEPQHTHLLNLTDGNTAIRIETDTETLQPVVLTTKVNLKGSQEEYIGNYANDSNKAVRIHVQLYSYIDRVKTAEVFVSENTSTENDRKSVGQLSQIVILDS